MALRFNCLPPGSDDCHASGRIDGASYASVVTALDGKMPRSLTLALVDCSRSGVSARGAVVPGGTDHEPAESSPAETASAELVRPNRNSRVVHRRVPHARDRLRTEPLCERPSELQLRDGGGLL